MLRNKKKEKGRGGILRGAIYAAASSAILLLFIAAAAKTKPVLANYSEPAVILINIISSVLCGIVGTGAKNGKRILPSLAAGALFVALIMLAAAITDLNSINSKGICEITLISLGGSAVGAWLKLCNSNKKLRYKSSK